MTTLAPANGTLEGVTRIAVGHDGRTALANFAGALDAPITVVLPDGSAFVQANFTDPDVVLFDVAGTYGARESLFVGGDGDVVLFAVDGREVRRWACR